VRTGLAKRWVRGEWGSILACLLLTFFAPAMRASAHGGEPEVVVEVASLEGRAEYGVGVHSADDHPVTEARVEIHVEQGDRAERVEAEEDTPGVYLAQILFPTSGVWRVGIVIHHPESEGSIQFDQTVELDGDLEWLVLVDTTNPDRVGSTPEPSMAVLEPHLSVSSSTTTVTGVTEANSGTPATTTASTDPESRETEVPAGSEVSVDLEASDPNPLGAVSLRVVHLGSIGLWLIPVLASVFGWKTRSSAMFALVGVILTAVTGVSLMLWGAPVAFPGIFDWGRLSEVPYGSSYLLSFLVKITAVLIAVTATLRWAWRENRRATWVALGGGVIAAVAVTAMSQYHLLSHL
jgi:hypothetical protein